MKKVLLETCVNINLLKEHCSIQIVLRNLTGGEKLAIYKVGGVDFETINPVGDQSEMYIV